MKKPSSSQKSKSSTSSAKSATRHAKSAKKQVTIDLKAEEVKKQPAESTATGEKLEDTTSNADAGKKPSKSSVPRSNAASTQRSFGRDAGKPSADKAGASSKPIAAPPAKSGTGGKIAAGIVGGLIALGGGAAVQMSGLLPSPQTGEPVQISALEETKSSLETRIAQLETFILEVRNAPAPKIDMTEVDSAIDEKMNKLAETLPLLLESQSEPAQAQVAPEEVVALKGQVSEAQSALETLKNQLLVTDKTVDGLKSAISQGSAGETAGLSALAAQVSTINTTLSGVSDQVAALKENPASDGGSETASALAELQAALPAQIQGLKDQISVVSDKFAALESNNTVNAEKLPSFNKDLLALTENSQKLDSKITAIQEAVTLQGESLDALKANISENAEKFPSLNQDLQSLAENSKELGAKITAIEGAIALQSDTLSALGKSAEASKLSEQNSARAIAAAALKSDIDRGVPFGESLARLRAIMPDNEQLNSLEPLAASAVPTVAQLSKEFEGNIDAIFTALAPPSDDSLTSRLVNGAQSLVKVRPINPEEGDSPIAMVSQIGGALNTGDLLKAEAAWQALPEAAQTASKSWHEKLVARITADAVVADTIQSFLKSSAGQ